MKIQLDGEYGVVLDEEGIALYGVADWNTTPKEYGVVRWDTEKENDIEDWRGLFGSFFNAGGTVVEPNHEFEFINDKGSIKAA